MSNPDESSLCTCCIRSAGVLTAIGDKIKATTGGHIIAAIRTAQAEGIDPAVVAASVIGWWREVADLPAGAGGVVVEELELPARVPMARGERNV